jgi:hypothetical protein
MVAVDVGAHSKHVEIIKYNFKPGSVGTSMDH